VPVLTSLRVITPAVELHPFIGGDGPEVEMPTNSKKAPSMIGIMNAVALLNRMPPLMHFPTR